MAKVGLKDTLALLAKGYTKKEIDALAAVDEENEQEKDPEPDPAPAPKDPEPAPAPEDDKEDPEPDYKKMYEDLAKENKETKAKLTKLQQDNVHKDSTGDSEKAKQEQYDSLLTTVRDFM